MRKNASAKTHKQAGFIQGLILPGLILIGVVIAALASLTGNSASNGDPEKANILSSVVLQQALTVTTAVQRAEADGVINDTTTATLAGDAGNTTTALATLLAQNKYITQQTLPTLPSDLPATAGTWLYTKALAAVQANGVDAGTSTNDDVLEVSLGTAANTATPGTKAQVLAKQVCQRINNKLFGTSTDIAEAVTTTRGSIDTKSAYEGCYFDGADFVYYKTVNIK